MLLKQAMAKAIWVGMANDLVVLNGLIQSTPT
jgi:hypothetical protein